MIIILSLIFKALEAIDPFFVLLNSFANKLNREEDISTPALETFKDKYWTKFHLKICLFDKRFEKN